jgi:formate/nitrite transporter
MTTPAPIDALVPKAMAHKAEELGVAKAQMRFASSLVLAILAGAFIGFGAMLSTLTVAGSQALPFGVARLLAGVTFSLGLILVVVGGAELFTGNTLLVMAWASRRVRTAALLRNWLIVYTGNMVGAVATAGLVFLSGQHLAGNGLVGIQALTIGAAKTSLSFDRAVWLGVLANALVCLAVWLTFSARSVIDKVAAIVGPITAFVAAGFEHSIANMYFIPFALLVKGNASTQFWETTEASSADYPTLTWSGFIATNLVPVTLGNIIGGAVLVGAVYWFVYLREDRPSG